LRDSLRIHTLPFGVTIPTPVPQRSEIPEGLMNYPVFKGLSKEIFREFHSRESKIQKQ
jgi:hypothetical protein